MSGTPQSGRWLLLIHQIPPRPTYLRVKIGRRLQTLGAVAVKNSVYALPVSDHAFEALQGVRREIVAGAGDASVCQAHFMLGLSDTGLEAIFTSARDADYAELAKEARSLLRSSTGSASARPQTWGRWRSRSCGFADSSPRWRPSTSSARRAVKP